ncbi:MAG: hypothetical protein A3K46_02655 [Chloroflexi bacterium RBG_13_60_9]|nr:MAG: hypothetical protein A3K46_02655 [Chloroflexi bacterium RBG_13_60_9]
MGHQAANGAGVEEGNETDVLVGEREAAGESSAGAGMVAVGVSTARVVAQAASKTAKVIPNIWRAVASPARMRFVSILKIVRHPCLPGVTPV